MSKHKLTPFATALKMGKEKLRETLIPVKVRKAKSQASLEMCKLDEEIAVKADDLAEACSREDVDFADIIEIQDDLILLERRKAQYQTILDEMFPPE